MHDLILASASPRRKKIMEELGLPFRIVVPQVIELFHPTAPEATVRENALLKNAWCHTRHPNAWIIAADRGGYRFGVSLTLINAAYFLMALVFAVRGVVTYALPGVFAYAKGTPFERLNRLYYSPLCLFIAFGLMAASLALL